MVGWRMFQRIFNQISDLLLKEMFFKMILGHQIFLCLLVSTLSSLSPSIPPVAVAKLKISVLWLEFLRTGVLVWILIWAGFFFFNSVFPSWHVECISTDGHGVLNVVRGFLISLTNFMIIAVHVHSTFPPTSTGRVGYEKMSYCTQPA